MPAYRFVFNNEAKNTYVVEGINWLAAVANLAKSRKHEHPQNATTVDISFITTNSIIRDEE